MMLPKSYTSPSESTSSGSIFRKLYSCPGQTHAVNTAFRCVQVSTPVDGTFLDVVSDDADVLVAVGPRVLVPEADHVSQFVNHNSKLIAVFPDGDGLRASTPPPHVGAAPAGGDTIFGQLYLQYVE